MRIRRILSVNMFVPSVDAVRPFYEDGLALQVGRSSSALLGLYPGETAMNLHHEGEEDRALVGRNTGITLRMRGEGDLKRLIKRLRNKGYPCADKDFGAFRGGHRLHIADPAGNRFTLFEDHSADYDDQNFVEGPSSVTVRVRNLQRSLGFYLTTLELPMLDQPARDTAVLLPGGTNLILAEGPSWSPAEPATGETGVVLMCEDPYSAFDHLNGMRVRFAEEPRETGDMLGGVIEDPDGNRLTLLGKT